MGASTARPARSRAKGSAQRVAQLVDEIRTYCAAHQDPSQLPKWQRYFKEGFDAWGLLDKENPLWTVKAEEWHTGYADLGVDGFLTAGSRLFASGKYEEGSLAIKFLEQHLDELTPARFARLDEWFASGLANWAHADVLCALLLTPMLRNGTLDARALEPWRQSPHRFQRRASAVAVIALLKTEAPTAGLLKFVEPLMADSERVVHQGVGWFLREAWKRDPAPVEKLLDKWKDRAARLIYQYATEKMTAAEKARFKRSGARTASQRR